MLIGLNSVDPDALDDNGWSALSYAAYYGHTTVAEVLLSMGANPSAAMRAHPYAVAVGNGNYNLATLFLPYWSEDMEMTGESYVPEIRVDAAEGKRAPRLVTERTIDTLGKLYLEEGG
jgi:hypothetical protein